MKTKKLFGTDGIRGRVGIPPIDAEFMLKLGWSVGNFISQNKNGGKVLIGKDTRVSGYMIEAALEAGLSAAGVDIYRLGSIPTAAIAYLTRTLRAEIGIVISASHNPYYDNGIKFFNSEGYKLTDAEEHIIEDWVTRPFRMSPDTTLGKAFVINDAQGRYIEYCKSCIQHKLNLRGLKIVLDCANGATYHIAPHVLTEIGADVITLHNHPDGYNINQNSGACHPEVLRQAVLSEKADIGMALDGDGDRIIMVDHLGNILDGDDIIYIIVLGLVKAKLFSGGIVGTHMSNMGLEHAIKNLGIHFIRTEVGDQNILQSLLEKKWLLGGEPSGHIIYLPVSTTGDGIIAALQVLQTMYTTGESLHSLKQGLEKYYQSLISLQVSANKPSLTDSTLLNIITDAENEIKNKGRILVRYSGTEPVLRIMVECEQKKIADNLAKDLADQLSNALKNHENP